MIKIALCGASGPIGNALKTHFKKQGFSLILLVRRPARNKEEVEWDPGQKEVKSIALEGLDAFINLSGQGVMDGRWSDKLKKTLYESRVQTTRFLCDVVGGLKKPPRAVLSASAIGYYGSRGSEILSEDSKAGSGFLGHLAQDWEGAIQPLADRGVTRVVNLRFGLVLSREGGLLEKMRTPFKLGLGAVLGSGSQYMSWVHEVDVAQAVQHALITESVNGPLNVVSPEPITNAELSKRVGRALNRPVPFRAPALALKALMGKEMAEETVLASQRVMPEKLLNTGYVFKFPKLDDSLKDLLD